jgi:NADP-dependent 3-hydroxy acid dehydrogenase YdfG
MASESSLQGKVVVITGPFFQGSVSGKVRIRHLILKSKITGASQGIGEHVARQLYAKGAFVVLAARNQEKLQALASELGANALAVVTDVTKRSDNEHLMAAAIERFGHVDVWINNAGRGISRPFEVCLSCFNHRLQMN